MSLSRKPKIIWFITLNWSAENEVGTWNNTSSLGELDAGKTTVAVSIMMYDKKTSQEQIIGMEIRWDWMQTKTIDVI